MPIDTSMYQTNPLRSIADYEGDLLKNDLAKQNISSNALALQEKQRSLQEQDALRNALAGLGGGATNEQRMQAARATGTQAGYSLADTLEKNAIEQLKTKSQAGKNESDILSAGIQRYRDYLPNIKSTEMAKQWVLAQYSDPATASFMSRLGPAESAISEIPNSALDPDGFRKWINGNAMSMEKAQELLLKQATEDRTAQNQPLIKGPDGTWVVNKPLETFRTNVAAAGAPQLGAPVAGVIPGTETPVYVQPPRTPGGKGQVLEGIAPPPKGDDKKRAADEKAVTKYSDTLQKHSIPDFENALSELEGVLSKYPVGKAPGLGRGVGLLPDWMQGPEGENLRQSLAGVKNVLLKARSGTAVTESELRRFVEELGSGGFRSEQTLRSGIERIRKRFEQVKANVAAGVSDDVKNQYEEQGGVKITRGGSKSTAAPRAQGKETTPTQSDLDAALKLYTGK